MGQFEKTVSIDKQLGELASKFDRAYGLWLSGDLSVPSSSATPDSKGVRPRANRVETRSDLPDQPIRGFINETLFLKNFLLKRKESEEFKTLAIVGKFGVGKTTLCQGVFNNEDVKQAYVPRIWVSMYSEETKEDEDPRIAVVKRILRSLGVEDEMFEHIKTEAKEEKQNKVEEGKTDEETVEEKELSRLLSCLNSNLIGKKYLIVLDDVWEDNKWSQRLDEEKIQQEKWHLSCGFPKGSGGRVIVTSRDERLAKEIVGQEENLQRLFPRSDAESVLEIYNDAFEKYMEDAVEKLIKAILGEPGPGGSVKVAVEKLMKGAAGEPMKVAVEKLMKGAAGEYMKGVVETLMKDAGGELKEDADGNKKILKIVVNPRYPGRYKQELMDKSCGIPWVAQKLAKIKPLKMDEDQDK